MQMCGAVMEGNPDVTCQKPADQPHDRHAACPPEGGMVEWYDALSGVDIGWMAYWPETPMSDTQIASLKATIMAAEKVL